MAEPKGTTLQQKFGFQDADLKTPAHDRIMLWLDENVEAVMAPLWRPERTGTARGIEANIAKEIEEAQQYIAKATTQMKNYPEAQDVNRQRLTEWSVPPQPTEIPVWVESKTWERVVKNGNFITGFIDLEAVFVTHQLYLSVPDSGGTYTNNGWVWDVPVWRQQAKRRPIYFEVKTAIPSLGEVIRQVRMYESALEVTQKFYIVCPDDRFKTPLCSQGIGFIKAPKELL